MGYFDRYMEMSSLMMAFTRGVPYNMFARFDENPSMTF